MTQPNPAKQSSADLPPADLSSANGTCATSDLLDSPDALETYLADVKRRREANREQRRRAYWQSAILRLREELAAARADRDDEIATELAEVVASFQRALNAAKTFDEPIDPKNGVCVDGPEQEPQAALLPAVHEAGTHHDSFSSNGMEANGTLGKPDAPHSKKPFPVAPSPADETARAELAAQCQDLRERIKAHFAVERGDLTYAFAARTLFCEGQSLALNPDTPTTGQQSLTDPMDDLAASKSEWGIGDPFCWRQQNFQVWTGQAKLYRDCAAASGFLDWYLAHEAEVPDNARVDILNAISAAQQRLYRHPDGVGKRDDAVHELYRRVRATSQTTGFIRALNPIVHETELSDLVAGSGRLFQEVQAEVEENRTRAERDAIKNTAVAAVVAWEEALEGRTVTEDSIDADREALCGLLDDCLAAGVSPTNIKVRTAILDVAPVLLESLSKYAKFLDAINTERAKRSLAAVEVAPPQEKVGDDDFSRMIRSLVDFTQKKSIVMLGGKSRPQVAEDLGGLLQCEVTWHDSDSGDKFAKFASKIKKADIVLLLKNFASHEMFYGSKDAMAAEGKHFVVLPSGYGVRQVVFQLSEYAARNTAGREKVVA